jgi:hypothetical protein
MVSVEGKKWFHNCVSCGTYRGGRAGKPLSSPFFQTMILNEGERDPP